MAGRPGFQDFESSNSVKTIFRTLRACSPVDSRHCSPGIKRPGRETDCSSLTSIEVKKGGAILSFPHTSCWDSVFTPRLAVTSIAESNTRREYFLLEPRQIQSCYSCGGVRPTPLALKIIGWVNFTGREGYNADGSYGGMVIVMEDRSMWSKACYPDNHKSHVHFLEMVNFLLLKCWH
jgi:hypothetical protein